METKDITDGHIMKMKRRIHKNSNGSFTLELPVAYGRSLQTRNADLYILQNGDVILRPNTFKIDPTLKN